MEWNGISYCSSDSTNQHNPFTNFKQWMATNTGGPLSLVKSTNHDGLPCRFISQIYKKKKMYIYKNFLIKWAINNWCSIHIHMICFSLLQPWHGTHSILNFESSPTNNPIWKIEFLNRKDIICFQKLLIGMFP